MSDEWGMGMSILKGQTILNDTQVNGSAVRAQTKKLTDGTKCIISLLCEATCSIIMGCLGRLHTLSNLATLTFAFNGKCTGFTPVVHLNSIYPSETYYLILRYFKHVKNRSKTIMG